MTTCMGCALKEGEIETIKQTVYAQRNMILNALIDLEIFLDEEDIDGARALIKQMMGEDVGATDD
jgi:hypothetical protein